MLKKSDLNHPAQKSGGGLRRPDRRQRYLRDDEGGTYEEETPERLRRKKDADKTIKEAVKDAQHTLTEYQQPGNRDCEDTIEKLITTLDNNDVAEAIADSDDEDRRDEPLTH